MTMTTTRTVKRTHRERRALDEFNTVTTDSVDAAKAANARERALVEQLTGLKVDDAGRKLPPKGGRR